MGSRKIDVTFKLKCNAHSHGAWTWSIQALLLMLRQVSKVNGFEYAATASDIGYLWMKAYGRERDFVLGGIVIHQVGSNAIASS